jgi:hypothetical protein
MRHFFRSLCMAALLFSATTHAFTTKPIDGLWGIDAESTLAIGRAFNFELTGNILVMTMYAYNAQRAPTFYTAAGILDASNKVVANMSEPTGGTCLGCTPTSGSLLSSPGQVTFEFTTSTTGFVTLPGETRKSMRKGAITWPAAPGGLQGLWVFTYMVVNSTSAVATSDVINFNKTAAGSATDNGMATDVTASNGCAYKTSGASVGSVICTKLTSTGTLEKTVTATWWGDQMDGYWQANGGTVSYNFTAKRLVSPTTDLVTIKRAASPPEGRMDAMIEVRTEALRAAMLQAEASLNR